MAFSPDPGGFFVWGHLFANDFYEDAVGQFAVDGMNDAILDEALENLPGSRAAGLDCRACCGYGWA